MMRYTLGALVVVATVTPAFAQTLATVNLADVGLAGSLTAASVTIEPGVNNATANKK